MKKYLVVATVLVALVALFSFSVSAADVALDANFTYNDEDGVTIDRIAVNLSGANAPENGGYYTVLAYTGNEDPTQADILYAAQEVNAITGFNIAADKLNGALYVKFGGSGIDDAVENIAEFKFALIAKKAGKNIDAKPYDAPGVSLTVSGADAYEVWGAELKGIDDAGLTEKQKELYKDKPNQKFAITSFRTIIPVVAE